MHVELADEDRARLPQPLRDRGVFLGNPVGQDLAAGGRRKAANGDVVLQRDRHAVQRPEVVSGEHHHLGRLGHLARLRLEDPDEGGKLVVHFGDPFERGIDQLDRRHFARLHPPGGVGKRQPDEFLVRRHLKPLLLRRRDG
jgi:hypothetical protein